MPIRKACDIIVQGKTWVVDVAKCNDQPMILPVGIGLEAEVIERADREAKNRWGGSPTLWKALSSSISRNSLIRK